MRNTSQRRRAGLSDSSPVATGSPREPRPEHDYTHGKGDPELVERIKAELAEEKRLAREAKDRERALARYNKSQDRKEEKQ